MTAENSYVLVTAAHNEAGYIEKTLDAVTSQTLRPRKWVIVSDGSTDATDDIVRRHAADHDFIELVRRESNDKGFASQARALMMGCERAGRVEHAFIGTLDADITFEPNYYESILAKFHDDAKLGVAGGAIFEPSNGKLTPLACDPGSVPGAIQLFRREAFVDSGGFLPLRRGGHDAIAEARARMHGWQVRSFPDPTVLHHRPCGASYGNLRRIHMNLGIREFAYGSHPLFEVAKCAYHVADKPCLLGSIYRLAGYCWAYAHNEPREVPEETIRYLQHEQLQRLWHAISHHSN
ncbi:MAG: glycosyltransferase family 2 protein [Phycisphaerales bacterium]